MSCIVCFCLTHSTVLPAHRGTLRHVSASASEVSEQDDKHHCKAIEAKVKITLTLTVHLFRCSSQLGLHLANEVWELPLVWQNACGLLVGRLASPAAFCICCIVWRSMLTLIAARRTTLNLMIILRAQHLTVIGQVVLIGGIGSQDACDQACLLCTGLVHSQPGQQACLPRPVLWCNSLGHLPPDGFSCVSVQNCTQWNVPFKCMWRVWPPTILTYQRAEDDETLLPLEYDLAMHLNVILRPD